MALSQAEVQKIVEQEVAEFSSPGMQLALQALLVAPARHPGDAAQQNECWTIARFLDGWGIAYAEQGHGSDSRWGLVECDAPDGLSKGDWFATLEEAFVESGEWDADAY